MKYQKKPVIVEAYKTDMEMDIQTLEGTMHASIGDYIITGVNGEQYPCKPDIFAKTYELLEKAKSADEIAAKPMTNADKYFRDATDEEIAKWIHRHDCHTNLYGYDNEEAILDWLKQEAEE
jgi:hypothetical protein